MIGAEKILGKKVTVIIKSEFIDEEVTGVCLVVYSHLGSDYMCVDTGDLHLSHYYLSWLHKIEN